MIVVFNALAWGFEHVIFDAALVASLIEGFPGEAIRFYGEAEHLRQMQRHLEPHRKGASVSWHEMMLPERLASPRTRFADDLRTTRRMLVDAQRHGASHVVAAYMHSTTGLLALKMLVPIYRRCPVAFIHHGSLLRLFSSRRYHPLLALANGRMRQIVLGEFIRTKMLAQLPRMRGSLYAIRLPYFFQDAVPSELPTSSDGQIGFSFLGLVDETKNFPAFVTLASEVSQTYAASARFDLIGGTRTGALPEDPGRWVTTYSQGGPMPRDVFEERLRETHYAVFPYNQSYYQLIASASVMDALTAGKPLIALRNAQFVDMFQAMGDIGYLCDDMHEMKALVEALVSEPPRARYRQQSQNILANRHIYSPRDVAAQLRAILSARA